MSRTRTAVTASLVALALSACGSASSSTAAPAAKSTPAATTTKAAVKTAKPAPTTTTPAPVPTSAVAVATSAVASPSAPPTPPSFAPTTTTGPSVSPRPHFTSPEAAMTYLAAAWNTNNMANLKHVTQGAARQLLLGMHHEALNLKLKSCALRKGGKGDYLCTFTHDYPKWISASERKATGGRAYFIAAPSSSVGWYMFAYEGCG